jgi:hypothetical protein
MKSIVITACWLVGWTAFCLTLSGCVTTTTTVTAPDGTVTQTRVTAPDTDAARFAAKIALAMSQRAEVVSDK